MIKGGTMKIKEVIQTILKQSDHTFETLAKALDITPSYLKVLEKGDRLPSNQMIKTLEKILKTSFKKEKESSALGSENKAKGIIEFLNDKDEKLNKDHLVDEE